MDADPLHPKAAELRSRALAPALADDLETARRLLEVAVRANPEDVAAWTNLGAVLGELGLAEEARRALERAHALDPSAVEPVANLGVLARESGELSQAENLFRGIVERVPENFAARYNLGHTLFLAARFDEAAAAYREGLRRDPARTPHQNARLVWALAASGQWVDARGELAGTLERLPPEEAEALLAEASEVLSALEAAAPSHGEGLADLARRIRSWARNR